MNNGLAIPSIGYGTSNMSVPCPTLKDNIIYAINAGYRHIDTADLYDNYKDLKEAFEEIFKTIKREELFITSKILNNENSLPENDIK